MRFCESEWERICRGEKERERETDRQKISAGSNKRINDNYWEVEENWLYCQSVTWLSFFFFFFNELNKKRQEVSMREKYSAPRTLFEALLFTVDILTMINTFVYFFSKNFFSRPRGRGSIIDFVILGNY